MEKSNNKITFKDLLNETGRKHPDLFLMPSLFSFCMLALLACFFNEIDVSPLIEFMEDNDCLLASFFCFLVLFYVFVDDLVFSCVDLFKAWRRLKSKTQ